MANLQVKNIPDELPQRLRDPARQQRCTLSDLVLAAIQRELAHPAWRHRHNVSAYDAMSRAVPRTDEAPLLTADGPLARAPELSIVVQHIRMA
jgi:predicted nucleic acid-binding protein